MDEDDIENFIEEVEKRPPLYDKSYTHSSPKLKNKLWEEICGIVIKDWETFQSDRKLKYIYEVQKKWQNLRNCFARELRIQKNTHAPKKRRKYKYIDKLMFLMDHVGNREYNKRSSNDESESEKSENGEEEEVKIFSRKRRRHSSSVKEEYSSFDQSALEFGQNESNGDNDSVQFAMSLVPMLSCLSDYQKVEAKIQILSVLKTIRWGPTEPHPSNDPIG